MVTVINLIACIATDLTETAKTYNKGRGICSGLWCAHRGWGNISLFVFPNPGNDLAQIIIFFLQNVCCRPLQKMVTHSDSVPSRVYIYTPWHPRQVCLGGILQCLNTKEFNANTKQLSALNSSTWADIYWLRLKACKCSYCSVNDNNINEEYIVSS